MAWAKDKKTSDEVKRIQNTYEEALNARAATDKEELLKIISATRDALRDLLQELATE